MFQYQLSFGEAVRSALINKYCCFSGRAARSEYWWFYLFTFLIGLALEFIMNMSGTVGSILSYLVCLALILPQLGVGVRRMHDIGKSGWWILINLIPLVGWILWIVWCCKDSQMTDNVYGPVPNMRSIG